MSFPARVQNPPLSTINVTPLVDVLLVLLIIFMISAPILTHRLPLDLPRGSARALPSEPVQVGIHADGTLYWNGERVDAAQLDRQLSLLALHRSPPSLHIRAEADTGYQDVAGVLALARSHGLTRIAF